MATFDFYEHTFTVKNLIYKGVKKTPYYQRRVPAELVSRFGGKKMLKHKIDVKQGSVIAQIKSLTAWHDQLFLSMKNDPDYVLPADKNAAVGLLITYGLKQGDGQVKLTALHNAGSEFTDQPHLVDFYAYYERKVATGSVTETDRLALQALDKPLPTLCSELWGAYIKDEERGEKWIQKHKRDYDRFLSVVGNLPVETLSTDHGRAYRDAREADGLKSGSVQKEINLIRAVISKGLVDLGILAKNPFERVKASNLGKDANKRATLDTSELKQVIRKCYELNDDLSFITLLILYTGARLGEIIGLRLEDVNLKGVNPSIAIVQYGNRSLKTANSNRILPIHPNLLPAIKAQYKAVSGEHKVLFPRYANGVDRPNSDAASATLNKRLRKMMTGKHITNHCFRHTLEDRFRNADIPKDRRDEFLGHAKQGSADHYGDGRALSKKKADLIKAINF